MKMLGLAGIERKNKMDKKQVRQETQKHIDTVSSFLETIIRWLEIRKLTHDKTKLEEPEFSTFMIYTEKLKDSTYGSEEYKQFLNEMKPALDHHYSENRHHPEHFENGVDGMNLVDIIEMFCDWKAATLRHNDGDIRKSIEINADRFKLSPQLKQIFINSIELLLKG